MRWTGLLSPRRLKVKNLLLFLAVLGIVLVLCLLQLPKSFSTTPSSAALTGIKLKNFPRVRTRLFGGKREEDQDGEEEEDVFQNLERRWKEPEWQVAEILRTMPPGKKPVVPVIVVEEHFEVLKYWFDAAETGAIPKKGNTLLHIDGHSDGAPPRDLSLVPWFRLPQNHSEVANMMQSNDVFIAGSAFTGLINRVIWVWPDWDREEHKLESDHQVCDVTVGWRTYYPSKGKPFRRLCACQKTRSKPQNSSEENDWECWDREPAKSEIGEGPLIKSMQCSTELSGVMEFIHENRALELLKQGVLISKEEQVMLDIDEDYYGCESSVMPLYSSGLPQKTINTMSDLMSKLLCVYDVQYEHVADKVFHTLVTIVLDFKARLCSGKLNSGKHDCVSDFEADKALIQMIPNISQSLEKAGIEELLCDAGTHKLMLQAIIRMLYSLENRQLEALTYVGVCLITAPTSYVFEPAESLHICHGFNVPGETRVTFHIPTQKENEDRSELLKNTLSLLPSQPSLVTVCRSVRDGYTPWAFFGYIEKAVLGVLEMVFKDVTQQSLHFDENLLGGQNGWPDRHRRSAL